MESRTIRIITWKGSVIEEIPVGSETPEISPVFELSEVPSGSELRQNDLSLVIGCKYDVYAKDYVAQWEGRLDELKIYSRALNAEEMKAVFKVLSTCRPMVCKESPFFHLSHIRSFCSCE